MIWANRNGIPRLEATSVSVNAANVTYNFNPRLYRAIPFSGLILFKLPSYTPPATAVPVVFNTGGNSVSVTSTNGAEVTSAELNQSGVYLGYYEGNVLQILTGLI